MEDKHVSWYEYEATQARHERTVKRLILAIIIAIALMFASNAIWLYAWLQYDYIGEEITVDSQDGGNANYIGHDGDINNGTSESEKAD